MHKRFKYRIYPTKSQQTTIQKVLDACRWVYNKVLTTRESAWKQEGISLSRYDTITMLPEWKRKHSFLNNAHSQVLQDACTRVDLAFQGFFRRVKNGEKPGYPHLKNRNQYNSFTYTQSGFRLLDDKLLYLSKIGNVKIKLHRPIEGTIKTLTVSRDRLGKWYACFSCTAQQETLPTSTAIAGIDAGLNHLATLSTGEHIPNPRFFRKDEKALAMAQHRLSQCEKGTAEYTKQQRVIQHIHQRIANHRRDFVHKLNHRLVNEFQIIVLEDLNIPEMQKNNFRGMNKSISDAAWSQLRQYIKYKAEYAGRTFLVVNPRNTSQLCSGCGKIVPKDLSVRVHHCPYCNLTLDRDVNAALNILAAGLRRLGENP